ncbi:MAG: hypothetical protein MJK13_09500, partial [Pseudomonadales bacterium]|nr:hypothetical protein [Pseudomonadales bacterium]
GYMMKKLMNISVFVLTLLLSNSVLADVMILKDGQTVVGTLVSRDKNDVVFEISGQRIKFSSSNVKSISFGAVAAPATATSSVVVLAGSRLLVKLSTSVNSKKHSKGHRFTAKLEADLVANNVVVAARGATVYGVVTEVKQSRRARGNSSIVLTITDIMVNNQMKPIVTTDIKAAAASTGKATVGRAARLAIVGGLANGSKGATNAAKVGLGVSLLTSGNASIISAGTMLEFRLTEPFSG